MKGEILFSSETCEKAWVSAAAAKKTKTVEVGTEFSWQCEQIDVEGIEEFLQQRI